MSSPGPRERRRPAGSIRKLFTPLVLLACLLVAPEAAEAGHERGADAAAEIDGDGVVKVTVTTRWRKTFLPPSPGGVDSFRFGTDEVPEPDCPPIPVDPPVGMKILRVSDGATMYSFPAGAFELEATTVAVDVSDPAYDERVQQLIIPLGTEPAPAQINPPLGLGSGLYDIEWNDYNRIPGINNAPSGECAQNGYGFRVRVSHDGQTHSGPIFDPLVNRIVVRGLEYSHLLKAGDPEGDPLTFTLLAGPGSPAYGPSDLVPGVTIDALAGEIRIPSGMTGALLDNAAGEPAGDYLLSIEIMDSTGMTSVRHVLLDAATTSNRPPGMPVVAGDPSVEFGESLALAITAADPDGGDTVVLSATNLEPWMVFVPTPGNPAVATLTGTPAPPGDAPGTFTVHFAARDDGSPVLQSDTARRVTVMGENLPPVFEVVPNREIATDAVTGTDQLNAAVRMVVTVAASDPNPRDNLALEAFFGTPGNLPPGASFVQTGRGVGVFEWTPDPSQQGVWGPGGSGPPLSMLGSDNHLPGPPELAWAQPHISVGPGTNISPSLDLYEAETPDRLVQPVVAFEGSKVRFDLRASDANHKDRVSIGPSALTPLPAGASLIQTEGLELPNPVAYEFSWMTAPGDAGEYSIEFKAEDSGNPPLTERRSVELVIAPLPGPPRILSVAPREVLPPAGAPVTIKGVNLGAATMVEVGSVSAVFAIEDDRTITFLTPGGSVDQLESVSVTTPLGGDTLPGALLYTLAPDSDRDGMQDCVESSFPDGDSDGRPNLDDMDSDDDGIPDGAEWPGSPGLPVIAVACNLQAFEVADTDGDGAPDYLDTDSDADGAPDSAEGENDIDLPAPDGLPCYRDSDCDGDGFPDAADNCRTTYQTDLADLDLDGFGDICDNCPEFFNPSQEAVVFGQQLEAVDEITFVWPLPADVGMIRGDLSAVSVYGHEPLVSLPLATYFADAAVPPVGQGFYYLLRPGGTCAAGSWQTTLGAEPVRDAALP